ncbi:MAG: MoxR-like ATPase [Gemmatimonadetes bacterium]|nr:MoxR-like ATPase [Gemmatimonadota bacterium]
MISTLRDSIAAQLVGREREASILTLALIAREHVLLVGPPGTAKSHLCRTTASAIDGARYCERLLSPTTAPEAIWGPVSISALRQDRYEHVTDGYAADAHVLYLDEVGRASPAILDTMLHLLGPERQALVGTKQVKSPLVSAIGSANTWPEDAAMLDRWLLRASVQYLPASLRRQLLTFAAPTLTPAITIGDLDAAHMASRAIGWTPDAYETFDAILGDLDEAGVAVSDRRLRASDKIVRAHALLRGGADVEPGDLEPLQWVLWSVPDQAATAAQKVVTRANPVGAKLDAMLAEADEISRSAIDAGSRLDAAQKLDALVKEATKVANEPGANGRAAKVVKFISNELMRVQGAILGLSAGKIEKMLA